MITDAEIRRLARSERVEPRIVELDYALGWALRGIANHRQLARRLVFKGGTCLRKCSWGPSMNRGSPPRFRSRSMPGECQMPAFRECLSATTSCEPIGSGIWQLCYLRAQGRISMRCGQA